MTRFYPRRDGKGPWSAREDEIIRADFEKGTSRGETAARLRALGFDRTPISVRTRARALGLMAEAPADWGAFDDIIRAGRAERLSYGVILQRVLEAGRAGTTRNAVIARAHRLGLCEVVGVRRPPVPSLTRPPRQPRRPPARLDAPVKPEHDDGSGLARTAAASPPSPSGLTGGPIRRRGARLGGGVDAPVKPEHDGAGKAAPSGPAGGVLFTAVGREACRWPVAGEGLALRVCGAPAAPGRSYCPACCRLAYEPQALRPVRPPHEVARRARRPDEARAERTGDMLDEIGEAA
ncbi:GcrA family cell cycle regulator [Xanthobacter tagetidis]|uniref:GcrA cell cycle regulator n=1 Tax=Xanthobacter tagetidis TaxID=60216 RepID=A0A3L7ALG5_9HYPH|nr:GcrA family cell cycle regulator [Xanthobacter tagetidis]MBB6308931.1 hypothetical protein [Xanthobacter tagetidis]RLP80560.1 hypothetical protein D9R14_05795 [Xanthobacter tagetidis]